MMRCWFCKANVPGTDERSRNWRCHKCHRLDARICFRCGTDEGFPIEEWMTPEILAKATGAVPGLDPKTRERVLCRSCAHDTYWVKSAEQEDHLTCLLCETTWSRFVASVHTLGVDRSGPARLEDAVS